MLCCGLNCRPTILDLIQCIKMIIELFQMATHVYNVYVASRTIIIAVEYMEIKKVYQIVLLNSDLCKQNYVGLKIKSLCLNANNLTPVCLLTQALYQNNSTIIGV